VKSKLAPHHNGSLKVANQENEEWPDSWKLPENWYRVTSELWGIPVKILEIVSQLPE
jgi:hypothetical protein